MLRSTAQKKKKKKKGSSESVHGRPAPRSAGAGALGHFAGHESAHLRRLPLLKLWSAIAAADLPKPVKSEGSIEENQCRREHRDLVQGAAIEFVSHSVKSQPSLGKGWWTQMSWGGGLHRCDGMCPCASCTKSSTCIRAELKLWQWQLWHSNSSSAVG